MPEVLLDDQGMYMVKAYNQYGMMQCKAMMAVLPDESKKPKETAPAFVTKLSDKTATIGEPLSLTVQLSEQPTPTYRVEWYKVSGTAISRPGHKIFSKFQVQGLLVIFIFKTRTKYFAA